MPLGEYSLDQAPSPTGGATLGNGPSAGGSLPYFAQNPSTPTSLAPPPDEPKKVRTGGNPHESCQTANADGTCVMGASKKPEQKAWYDRLSESVYGEDAKSVGKHLLATPGQMAAGVKSDYDGNVQSNYDQGSAQIAAGQAEVAQGGVKNTIDGYAGIGGGYLQRGAAWFTGGGDTAMQYLRANDPMVFPEAGPLAREVGPGAKVESKVGAVRQETRAGQDGEAVLSEEEKAAEKAGKKDPKKKSEPVIVTRGEYVEDREDFAIPGTIPLIGSRHYGSQMESAGPLGRNRTSVFDVTISVTGDNGLIYSDQEGCRVEFDRPFNLSASYNAKHRHLSLTAPWLKQLVLSDGRLARTFHQGGDRVYRLVRIEDLNGNAIQLARSPEGVLLRTEHSDGHSLAFDNDGSRLRTAVRLEVGGVIKPLATYAYDAAGNMIEADCTTAFSISYAYDAEGRLASWRDATGRTWGRFAYDEANRVVRIGTSGPWDGDTFAYDAIARRTAFRPGGQAEAESTEYDAEENVLAETDALGQRTAFRHENGYLTATIDPLGHETRFRYDRDGNLSECIDAEGRKALMRWAAPGQLVVSIDPAAGVRRYERDARGNVVLARDPLGHETRYVWTSAGRLAAILRPDGKSERRRYDEAHRLIEIVDAKGGVTRFTREDPFGRITSVTDPLGASTRFAYDDVKGKALDLPTQVTRPDGIIIRRTFDGEGLVASVTDGENRTTRYVHGAFDQLVAIIDPKGGIVSLAYDARGHMAKVTNAMGAIYTYERDPAGRVVAETDFDGRRINFRRDASGRVVERLNADGGVILYEHDRTGLLVSRRAFAPGADPERDRPEEHETFAYDGCGRIVEARNSAGVFAFARDKAGKVLSEVANGHVVESTYDPLGRRVRRSTAQNVANYVYDPLGALSELALDGDCETLRVAFERDALGRETARRSGEFELSQDWDAVGQLRGQRVTVAGRRGAAAAMRTYDWNRAFEPTRITDDATGRTSFVYDPNGQVTEARHGESLPAPAPDSARGILGLPGEQVEIERFAYDDARNIAASDHSLPGEPTGRPLTAWLSSAGGKVKAARGPRGERILLTHDVMGRVVERRIERAGFRPKVWRLRWNALGRLVSASSSASGTISYNYDPFDRRTKVSSNVKETDYFWDGDLIIGSSIMDKEKSAIRRRSWEYEIGSFRPIVSVEDGSLNHIVSDNNGKPYTSFDQAGRRQAAWPRFLWGARRDEGPSGCPHVYEGQVEDEETGLIYNRFRYYDAAACQYVSSDPLGLDGGIRPQAYVACPTKWRDPLGLSNVLSSGYTYRVDQFNTTGGAGFEVHVYDPGGSEVAIAGPTDFINKHGIDGSNVDLPSDVQDSLKGVQVDQNRKLGLLPDKGEADITGDKWKSIVKCRLAKRQ